MLEKELIAVVDIPQRIPSERGIRVAQVEHHYLVAALLQKLAVELEQLALRVGADHRGARAGLRKYLYHRVDESGRLTGAGGADDKSVHRGGKVEMKSLLVVHRTHRYTVLLALGELVELIGRKVEITLLVVHEARVLKRGVLHLRSFGAVGSEQALFGAGKAVRAHHRVHRHDYHKRYQPVQVVQRIQKNCRAEKYGGAPLLESGSQVVEQRTDYVCQEQQRSKYESRSAVKFLLVHVSSVSFS